MTYPTLSYTQAGPTSIHGVSNYYLLIYPYSNSSHILRPDSEVPLMVLYILDSNGGQLPEELYTDETDWLASTQKTLYAQYGDLPSLLFVHIPPPEYQTAYVRLSSPDSPCIGK